jgi:putative ABC transport system permease protein
MRLGLAGTAVGLAAAIVLGRVLGSALYMTPGSHTGLLYGVSVSDPATFAAAGAIVAAISLAAGLIPARRATRVDPVVALRLE